MLGLVEKVQTMILMVMLLSPIVWRQVTPSNHRVSLPSLQLVYQQLSYDLD